MGQWTLRILMWCLEISFKILVTLLTSISIWPFFVNNFVFHACSLQTIAGAIVVGIILHAGNHLACDFPRLVKASDSRYHKYLIDFGSHKPTYLDLVRGVEGVTGILMLFLMIIAFTLATSWFRRSVVKLPKPFDRITGFNAFWYSHHLFVIVYILLILHGTYLYLVHEWYLKTV